MYNLISGNRQSKRATIGRRYQVCTAVAIGYQEKRSCIYSKLHYQYHHQYSIAVPILQGICQQQRNIVARVGSEARQLDCCYQSIRDQNQYQRYCIYCIYRLAIQINQFCTTVQVQRPKQGGQQFYYYYQGREQLQTKAEQYHK